MSTTHTPTPTILISSLPPKTLIGIDLVTFTSTSDFHGIKNLPAGAHFLYHGTTESFSLRSGEWFFVASQQQLQREHNGFPGASRGIDVRLRKWDAGIEGLVPVDEGTEAGLQEAMRQRANLGRLWQAGRLFAYRQSVATAVAAAAEEEEEEEEEEQPEEKGEEGLERSHHNRGGDDWHLLTNSISPSVLSRILGTTTPDKDVDGRPRWVVSSASSAAQDTDHIPGLTTAEVAGAGGVAGEQEKDLRFLPIDLKRTWREGAVGRERTEAAQDRSWALGDIIRRYHDVDPKENGGSTTAEDDETRGEAHVLGEMQFTFLMVLTLMNFSCLEQWKRLLGLILTCRAAIGARRGFFVKVLRLLKLQLRHCDDVEGGLFEMDGDDGGALLRKLLTGFRKVVDGDFAGGNGVPDVQRELELLETWVQREYGWETRQGAIVRRGMVELEDGERVELEISGTEEDDETGDYAPVVVDLGEGGYQSADVDMEDTPTPTPTPTGAV
ncbi:hypothetical protein AJ80_05147 [Polytolypa hystricis UAMH7299]|uniref:AAR2 family protein n=1 Tax=Polytolypa hystricis (strain UAMH7299) TaxID=1447883 RepID=A0A2B7Y614_POLH7|nr:hypothetical protein AJ80_05147 [Polytolypa hystricis UAMH7299]